MEYIPKNSSTFRKIKMVQDIVKKHYEPGNQSKSYRRIFREIVSKQIPISERTFRRYLTINLDDYKEEINKIPLKRYETPIL